MEQRRDQQAEKRGPQPEAEVVFMLGRAMPARPIIHWGSSRLARRQTPGMTAPKTMTQTVHGGHLVEEFGAPAAGLGWKQFGAGLTYGPSKPAKQEHVAKP